MYSLHQNIASPSSNGPKRGNQDGVKKVPYDIRKVSGGVRMMSYAVWKVSDIVRKASNCVRNLSDGIRKVSNVLADPGKAKGCSTKTSVIHSFIR